MKGDIRPVLALYYHPRIRSPSSTDQYKFMRDHSKIFRTILITDTAEGMDLEREMKKHNNGNPPDIVWDGFGAYTGALRSKDYITTNDVKYVRTVGDVEVHSGTFFSGAGHHSHNTEMITDALFFPVSPKTPAVDRLRCYIEDLYTQQDSELICIPFGVDTDKFKPNKEKNHDIIACYTVDPGNAFQDNRVKMNRTLESWTKFLNDASMWYENNKENTEAPQYPTAKRMFDGDRKRLLNKRDIRIHTGPVYHEEYPQIVNDAVIALSDTSKRQYMTNKYIEFGSAECAVVGEVPVGYDDLLNKDTMFGLDMLNVERSLTETLDYLMFTEDGIKDGRTKGRRLRNLIKKNYSLERTCEKIEKAFKELL